MATLTLTKQVNWYRWWQRNWIKAEVEIVEYKDGSGHLHISNAQGHTLKQPFDSFKVCKRYFVKQWATKNFALTLFYGDGYWEAFPKLEE